jgi:hypothetical protein
MTREQVDALQTDDQVYWNDPDGGLCSRIVAIQEIRWIDDEHDAVRINTKEGDCLEAFITELG